MNVSSTLAASILLSAVMTIGCAAATARPKSKTKAASLKKKKKKKKSKKAAEKKAPKSNSILNVGDAAPMFRLRALDGAMIRLDELAYEGKEKSYAKKRPIFLDFFRTDCEPCLKAMPELVGIHDRHSADGLQVILVALLEEEDGRAKLDAYLKSHKLPFTLVIDSAGHFAKQYLGDPVTLPASFLINRVGKLQQVKYGGGGSYDEHFGKEIADTIAEHKANKS